MSAAPLGPGGDRRGCAWRRGCLLLSLAVLLLAVLAPCALAAGVVLAAAQPGGFEVGRDSLRFSALLWPGEFRLRLRFRDILWPEDALCYRDEALTVLFNPLEVRRVPGCQCVVSGPGNSYQLQDCAPR